MPVQQHGHHDDRKMDRRRGRGGGSSNNNSKGFCSTYYSQCIIIGLLVNIAVFAYITAPSIMKSIAPILSTEYLSSQSSPVSFSLVTSTTQSNAGASAGASANASASASASNNGAYTGATTSATVYTRQDGTVRQRTYTGPSTANTGASK